jgi:hypothetical protein
MLVIFVDDVCGKFIIPFYMDREKNPLKRRNFFKMSQYWKVNNLYNLRENNSENNFKDNIERENET